MVFVIYTVYTIIINVNKDLNMSTKIFNFKLPQSDYDALVEKHNQEIRDGTIPVGSSISERLRGWIKNYIDN